ncbi:MAG TPA: ABC transporter substrate-binding protein [Dehalococcoidia bacterium]|nr:ABC transporter substrate-binding protein [Dehalococcoidia bacterium]
MAGRYWDKVGLQQVSRRRVLQGAGVAGAAAGAAWLVGCGGTSTSTSGTTPSANTPAAGATPSGLYLNPGNAPKRGGIYKIGTSVDFDTFDPHLSIAGGVGYFPKLYNVVINRSPKKADFRFDDLGISLEQPDNLTYIFTIRDGVKIGPNQLGVPERNVDAADVKATFDRIKALPQSNAYAFVGQWIQSVEASPDGKTLTIKTPKPYGYFFYRIGSPLNTIVPRELIDTPDKMKSASAGGGPFVLNPGKYVEGQGALLERNSGYYRKDEASNNAQLPYVDGISVKIIADRSAQSTAFQSGQIDTYGAQNVDDAKSLQSNGNYAVDREPTDTFISFTMNPTTKPWDDIRIRQAAMYALNRQEYIDRVYKGEAKADGLVHWSLGDYALPPDELAKLQPYDPTQAKQLIKAATGNDTIDINVMWPAESNIEEHSLHLPVWLRQMKDAGFNVKADAQAFPTWLGNYTNLKYDASLALNQIYGYAEFEMDFEHSEGAARNHIYSIGIGKLYPEIDAAIDASKGVTDPVAQAKKVQDVQRQIYAKGPMFLPLVTPYAYTLYQSYVKNIPQNIGTDSTYVLATTYLDKA